MPERGGIPQTIFNRLQEKVCVPFSDEKKRGRRVVDSIWIHGSDVQNHRFDAYCNLLRDILKDSIM